MENGFASLVSTIVELLRQLIGRRTLRYVEEGDLSHEQVERRGTTLGRLEERMAALREHFGLEPEGLDLEPGRLGPLPTDE